MFLFKEHAKSLAILSACQIQNGGSEARILQNHVDGRLSTRTILVETNIGPISFRNIVEIFSSRPMTLSYV